MLPKLYEKLLNLMIELDNSVDNTGCSEDLTVVSQEALESLAKFVYSLSDKVIDTE